MKRVLVADHPAAIPELLDMLGNRFNLAACTTTDQAIGVFDNRIGLILCGVHFDHGRLLTLLHAAKTHPFVAPIRFLAIRLFDEERGHAPLEKAQATVNTSGIDGFLDIAQWKRSVGEEYAKAKLQICIDYMALDQRQIEHRDVERRRKDLRNSDMAYA